MGRKAERSIKALAKAPSGVSTGNGIDLDHVELAAIRRNRRGLQAYRDIWSSVQMDRPTSSGTVPILACTAILFFFIKPSVSSGLAALGISLGGTIALVLAVWAIDKLLLRAERAQTSSAIFEIAQPDDGISKRQYAVFDPVIDAGVIGLRGGGHYDLFRQAHDGTLQYFEIKQGVRGATHRSDYPMTYSLEPIVRGSGRIFLRGSQADALGIGRNPDDIVASWGVKRGNE